MLTLRKMTEEDVPRLYEIALRAFQRDQKRYGIFPPLLNTEKQRFLPSRRLGLTILDDGVPVGGAFVLALLRSGELGSIFLDPDHQGKGLGRAAILAIEQRHPRVRRWHLETPGESTGLHRFYESLGYRKVREFYHKPSNMTGVRYEKHL